MNPELSPTNALSRQRLTITGVVQGVGFRPFVYGLALRYELAGFVGNDSAGVFIEIEGKASRLVAFGEELVADPPPLAHIESISVETIAPQGTRDFTIAHSQAQAAQNTLISPDICTCEDCLRELFDPKDRRYRYPFINCTNCGPRFTIMRDIPYDRPSTTMVDFPMCAACQAEYDDPLDRRFHAQPNACPTCGPALFFEASEQNKGLDLGDMVQKGAIERAQKVLAQGGIVAVKGLGGFHLACDATNDAALDTLRQRKGRVDKPFAVMARDVEGVRRMAELSVQEERLLTSKERPIVLLRKKQNYPLSELVAPNNPYIGVMLPYTPLHYLLLSKTDESQTDNQKTPEGKSKIPIQRSRTQGKRQHTPKSPLKRGLEAVTPLLRGAGGVLLFPSGQKPSPPPPILVMTSGNYVNEPIVKDNQEACERLSGLADALLLHNREIHIQCDDSVMRVVERQELPIRRSRGYAPFPVKLPFEVRPILAVGGELKSTFCLTKGQYAFMSQHIGDMEALETLEAFERAVAHAAAIFRIEPDVIVSDKHPRYLSTRWASQKAKGLPQIQVQHHHAHIASVMAEHGLDGSQAVIGFAFDGTGYGSDGAIWGGEVLIADYKRFTRAAYLKYVPLAGGDAAIKRPYRMALAHLWAAGIDWEPSLPAVDASPAIEQKILKRQLERGLNTVPTSSMGRLFDAVASLVGVRQHVTYEGQAAMEFEALAEAGIEETYHFEINGQQFDAAPVIRAIANDVQRGLSVSIIAAKFHNAVADLILTLSLQLRTERGLNNIALSGGVFQNATLLKRTTAQLRAANFRVLTHRLVPPNDGGLALGQAIIGSQYHHRVQQERR